MKLIIFVIDYNRLHSNHSKFDANSYLQWNEIIFNIQLDCQGPGTRKETNNCKTFSEKSLRVSDSSTRSDW